MDLFSAAARAGWLTILLVIASMPHALEDFEFHEPAKLGVPVWVAITVLCVAYVLQIAGAILCFRDRQVGLRIVLITALVWIAGAVIIHGPEITAAGREWRFGFTSIADVALIIVIAVMAAASALTALQSKK